MILQRAERFHCCLIIIYTKHGQWYASSKNFLEVIVHTHTVDTSRSFLCLLGPELPSLQAWKPDSVKTSERITYFAPTWKCNQLYNSIESVYCWGRVHVKQIITTSGCGYHTIAPWCMVYYQTVCVQGSAFVKAVHTPDSALMSALLSQPDPSLRYHFALHRMLLVPLQIHYCVQSVIHI